jgi:hypothetical protein
MQRNEIPLKITSPLQIFLLLRHQIPKGLVILRWRRRRIEWQRGTELRWWSWCWVVVIKMISGIPKNCVQCVEVALKLGLAIRDLLVLL